jgi:hypothetical protein
VQICWGTKERIAEALAGRCLVGRQSPTSSTPLAQHPQAVLREMLAMSVIAARSLNAEFPKKESDEKMPEHKIGTREEWQAARDELAKLEAEQADRNEKIKEKRLALPWVRVEKEYEFDTENGKKTLAELFDGRSQLLAYNIMFGPDYTQGRVSRVHEPRRRPRRVARPPRPPRRDPALLLAGADRAA